ncbi:hypothetical protein EDD22DRAFT_982907 [Suillus occidentalis]|nr:hypothetical protein EDD22DRAFT_982907 [Suillus occidentalis]
MKEWVSPVYAFFDPTPCITEDVRSTGNMRKHVKSCWGEDALNAADDAKGADDVILKNGSITASFERKGKGKVTYLHCQHTHGETRAEIIVKDQGFQSLMKTGRPEYYIPSPSTISLAKMLQEYDSKINFTTDTWSSPNHRAFVAFSVHLEHKGIPLSLPLDIIEVAKLECYLTSDIENVPDALAWWHECCTTYPQSIVDGTGLPYYSW